MKKTAQKKMVVLLAAALVFGTMAGRAFAMSDIHLASWKTDGVCQSCDLSSPNASITIPATTSTKVTATDKATKGLYGADLSGSTLGTGFSLAGYKLQSTKFNKVKMTNGSVSFAGAIVSNTVFNDTEFGTADLSGITAATTAPISFTGANLTQVKKPTTWPGKPNFSNAKWTATITCSNDTKSSGGLGCYNSSTCAPTTVSGGNSGYVNNDGTCKKNP